MGFEGFWGFTLPGKLRYCDFSSLGFASVSGWILLGQNAPGIWSFEMHLGSTQCVEFQD